MSKSAKMTKNATSTQQPVEQPRSPVDADAEQSVKQQAIVKFKEGSKVIMDRLEKYSKIENIQEKLKAHIKDSTGKTWIPNKSFIEAIDECMNKKKKVSEEKLRQMAIDSMIDSRYVLIAERLKVSNVDLIKKINDKNPKYLKPSDKFFEVIDNLTTVDDILNKINPKKERSKTSSGDASSQQELIALLNKLDQKLDKLDQKVNKLAECVVEDDTADEDDTANADEEADEDEDDDANSQKSD
tara:strand:+ start:618 stop:1343 length:726 start_codon:yes stop_codon:yes gene_type:complete